MKMTQFHIRRKVVFMRQGEKKLPTMVIMLVTMLLLEESMKLAISELKSANKGIQSVLQAMAFLDGISQSSTSCALQIEKFIERQDQELKVLEQQADTLNDTIGLMTGHLEIIQT